MKIFFLFFFVGGVGGRIKSSKRSKLERQAMGKDDQFDLLYATKGVVSAAKLIETKVIERDRERDKLAISLLDLKPTQLS